MDYKVVMPRLSDSMDEGMLVEWKIHPGDQVKSGDVIAEVESDKAVMEIQTFKSGRVKSLLLNSGTLVPVGTAIAVIDTEATAVSAPGVKKESPKAEAPEVKKGPAQAEVPSATAIKDMTQESPAQNIVDTVLKKELSVVLPSTFSGGNASPRARAEAAKYALDIEMLQKEEKLPVPAHYEDIKRYYIRRYFTPKALHVIAKYHLSTDLFEAGKKHDEAEIEQYVKMHEIPLPEPIDIAKRSMITMLDNAAKKPIYHMSDQLDTQLLKQYETKKTTVTVWLLKLFATAMMRHDSFRTTLESDTLQVWPNANISLAMAQGDLLYMPVFKAVNKSSIAELTAQLQEFKEKLKTRRLSRDDLSGSTFGISNLGMTGIRQFDAMINKDDCAIAAIGTEIESTITVTLTVDHRLINGFQAAQFMQELKALAEDTMFFKEAIKSYDAAQ